MPGYSLRRLKAEHEAIRAQVKLLRELVSSSSEDGVLSIDEIAHLEQALGYFRDGIREHILLDEATVLPHAERAFARELRKQHEIIGREIERALGTIKEGEQGSLTSEEEREYSRRVSEAFRRAGDLIYEHTCLEDQVITALDKKG